MSYLNCHEAFQPLIGLEGFFVSGMLYHKVSAEDKIKNQSKGFWIHETITNLSLSVANGLGERAFSQGNYFAKVTTPRIAEKNTGK